MTRAGPRAADALFGGGEVTVDAASVVVCGGSFERIDTEGTRKRRSNSTTDILVGGHTLLTERKPRPVKYVNNCGVTSTLGMAMSGEGTYRWCFTMLNDVLSQSQIFTCIFIGTRVFGSVWQRWATSLSTPEKGEKRKEKGTE